MVVKEFLKAQKPNFLLLSMVFPAVLLLAVFILYPTLSGFYYSLTSWNGVSSHYNFVGMENFKSAFSDEYFIGSIFFTLKFTLFNVLLTNAVGLLLAVLLNFRIKLTGILRTVFFTPYVIAIVVCTFIWTFMFNNVLNALFNITGWEIFSYDWFGSAGSTFFMIMVMSIWYYAGYLTVIYIAGLKSIDESLLEAAKIDGASEWQMFTKIRLPLIVPSIVVCIFMMTMNSLKVFEMIYTFTFGGPFNSTRTMAIDIYRVAFEGQNAGMASAKSIVLFIMVMIITFLEVYSLKRKEVEA